MPNNVMHDAPRYCRRHGVPVDPDTFWCHICERCRGESETTLLRTTAIVLRSRVLTTEPVDDAMREEQLLVRLYEQSVQNEEGGGDEE